MRMFRRWSRSTSALIASALLTVPLQAANPVATTPADLRVRWESPEATVEGRAGMNVELSYEVANVGGAPAFAVVVSARSTVGAVGPPVRIQPGPKAGDAVKRKVSFALVRGMRELCLDAALQQRAGGEPPDPDLTNNRICRAITIVSAPRRPEEEPR